MLSAALIVGTYLLAPAEPNVNDLGWMTGTWSAKTKSGTFSEFWSKPISGTMVGMGREIGGGKTLFMEHMSIETKNGKLGMYMVLGALSEGKKDPFLFTCVSTSASQSVWVHPGHDFPDKVVYEKKGADEMVCTLTGKPGGKAQKEIYNFSRSK